MEGVDGSLLEKKKLLSFTAIAMTTAGPNSSRVRRVLGPKGYFGISGVVKSCWHETKECCIFGVI